MTASVSVPPLQTPAADDQQEPTVAVLLLDATSTGAADGDADRGSV
jgi:hypothetical protein